MDNSILVWGVTALVTILFLVALVLSFKTWKVMHIIAMLFVYGAAIAVCIYTAISLKTNAAWKQKVKELREQIVVAEQKKAELEFGLINTGGNAEESLVVLPERLWRATYDQGLVLRGCAPGNYDGASVTVDTAPATTPAAPSGAAPAATPVTALPNGLSPKMIVFVFKESDQATGKVPVIFLGEWEVTAATDTNVTLRASLPLDRLQTSQLAGGTWSIYGRLPRDNHFAFADHHAADPVQQAKEAVGQAEQAVSQAKRQAMAGGDKAKVATAEATLKNARKALADVRAKAHPLFGQPLSTADLSALPDMPPKAAFKQLLPQTPAMDAAEYDEYINKLYDAFLKRYAYDGRPVQDIAADDADFKVDGNIFQKVKFTLANGATYDVEVDSPTAGVPFDANVDQKLFDSEGRALADHLRQGAPTKYSKEYDPEKRKKDFGPTAVDDIGIFDQATAEVLVTTGKAEKLDDQFYVRPLRDFAFIYHEYARNDRLLDQQSAAVTAATAKIVTATELAQNQVNVRQIQKTNLESDLVNFTRDLSVITDERQNLEAAQQAQVNTLRQLFVGINERLAELNRLQAILAEEARRRAELVSTSGE